MVQFGGVHLSGSEDQGDVCDGRVGPARLKSLSFDVLSKTPPRVLDSWPNRFVALSRRIERPGWQIVGKHEELIASAQGDAHLLPTVGRRFERMYSIIAG